MGARWLTEESTAAADVLGDDERLVSMANGSTAMPEAAVETTGTSGVEARVANAVLESRAEKPAVPEEQTACPETSKGVVGHAVRP